MKKLTQLSVILAALLIPFACGQNTDKAAKLAQLKDQKAKIEAEITALEKEIGGGQTAPKVRLVGLTELNPGLFRHYIDLQGRIEAEQSIAATSKMPGTLTKVYVDNGDAVRQGQLIAQLDDAVMGKSLAELEGRLKDAEDFYNRQKGLWDQKIGTEIQYLTAKNGKEALERSIATLKEQMAMSKIYAPIGGTVDMVFLKQGQSIAPGMPLCNILNLSKLKIRGEVPEAYAAKVRQGDQVLVQFPDLNKEITSRVTYVSKSINNATRTFSIECALPGGAEYRANMVAVMKIIDYQNANAITVPVNVLQTAEDGDFVLIAEKTSGNQGTVKKVTVKQGNNYNGQVEITSGLKKGDALITTGFQDVNNGETVGF